MAYQRALALSKLPRMQGLKITLMKVICMGGYIKASWQLVWWAQKRCFGQGDTNCAWSAPHKLCFCSRSEKNFSFVCFPILINCSMTYSRNVCFMQNKVFSIFLCKQYSFQKYFKKTLCQPENCIYCTITYLRYFCSSILMGIKFSAAKTIYSLFEFVDIECIFE